MDINELWRSLEHDRHAETHAAEAFALAALALVFLLPITGSLVLADLGRRSVQGGSGAGPEIVLWAALVMWTPLLLIRVFRRLGSRARWTPAATGLYGTFIAICVAGVIARSALPELGGWVWLPLLAAGSWALWSQLRVLHGLERRAAAKGLGVALIAWVLVPAKLGHRIPVDIVRSLEAATRVAYLGYSFPARSQPGSGGPQDAAVGYYAADAMAVDYDTGTRMPATIHDALEANDGWSDPKGDFGKLLDRNEKTLAAFRAAARLPFCDFGRGVKTITYENSFPNRFHPLRLSKLALLDARREASRGRLAKAVDDYVAALAMARHFAIQRNALSMHAFCFRTIIDTASPGLSRLLREGKASRSDYERLLAALRAVEADKPSLAAAVQDEERRLQRSLEAAAPIEAGVLGGAFRDPFVETEPAIYALKMQSVIDAAEKNLPGEANRVRSDAARALGLTSASAEFWDSFKVCLDDPKAAGRCWSDVHLAWSMDYSATIVYHYLFVAQLDVLETAAAVRVYEMKHGAPPEALADLVPEQLARIPEDPFDWFKPLRYVREPRGWLVYSFGPDRVDHGGRIAYDLSKTFDGRHDWRHLTKGDIVLRAD